MIDAGSLGEQTQRDSPNGWRVFSAQNHARAIAIHIMYYNFVRIHKTLRVAPAMAAGVTDRLWELEDIVAMADDRAPKPVPRGLYKRHSAN